MEASMKISVLASFVAASLLSANALAADAELLKAKNCFACHAVDKKVVGPAYKDVAAKYAGQKDAEDKLVQKVIKGSSGTWGTIPMPPNNVTEKEAHSMVQWVLAQKK
jgi:cytochrome c